LKGVLGLAVPVLGAASGCVLVTDLGTGGYELAEAGACSAADDASCSAAPPVFCASTGDCATGEICCLTASLGQPVSIDCQMGPSCPGTSSAQLCAGDGDCGGATCMAQTCPVYGSSMTIHTCGSGVGLSLVCTSAPP
jgi:hypothetical protein